jgi:hypothetical protein
MAVDLNLSSSLPTVSASGQKARAAIHQNVFRQHLRGTNPLVYRTFCHVIPTQFVPTPIEIIEENPRAQFF